MCAPWALCPELLEPLLKRFPGLVRFSSWGIDGSVYPDLELLAAYQPYLRELAWRSGSRFRGVTGDSLGSFLLDERGQLSTFSLDLDSAYDFHEVLRPHLFSEDNNNSLAPLGKKAHFLYNALVCLTIVGLGNQLYLGDFFEPCKPAPLPADPPGQPHCFFWENRPPPCPLVACTDLKLLRLGIYSNKRSDWIGADKDKRLWELARSFMEQLGSLEKFQELDQGFRSIYGSKPPPNSPSPFLHLALGKPNGLEQPVTAAETREVGDP